MHIGKLISTVFAGAFLALVASSVSAIPIGLGANGSGATGYDLGGGIFATEFGLQASSTFDGETITVADLNSLITSGSISAYYYSTGNAASGMFDNIVNFGVFTSDSVSVAGGARADRVWNSLWAIHTSNVVFTNGRSGTNTLAPCNGQQCITGQNPFATPQVPEPSALILVVSPEVV
jgi:hypothetical protein